MSRRVTSVVFHLFVVTCGVAWTCGCDDRGVAVKGPASQNQFISNWDHLIETEGKQAAELRKNPLNKVPDVRSVSDQDTGKFYWLFEITKIGEEVVLTYERSMDGAGALLGAIVTGEIPKESVTYRRFTIKFAYQNREAEVTFSSNDTPAYLDMRAMFAGMSKGQWVKYAGNHVLYSDGSWYLHRNGNFQKQ